jgi:hypothetical protein
VGTGAHVGVAVALKTAAMGVDVGVPTGVGVLDAVGVGVGDGVRVTVGSGVGVAVASGVGVAVSVGVGVLVGVTAFVAVGGGLVGVGGSETVTLASSQKEELYLVGHLHCPRV